MSVKKIEYSKKTIALLKAYFAKHDTKPDSKTDKKDRRGSQAGKDGGR